MSVYLLMTSILSNNPCHPDCQAYMCNGPLSTDCNACQHPLQVVRESVCSCKIGYFDNGAERCSLYLKHCRELASTQACAKCDIGQ